MNESVKFSPSPETRQSRLLTRICDANLPNDANKFTLEELKSSGLLNSYTRPPGWSDHRFVQFVLLAIQSKELRKQRDALQRRTDNLQRRLEELLPYRSPLWDEASIEPCPIEEARLRRAAQVDDARVSAERRRQATLVPADPIEFTNQAWKTRDTRSLGFQFQPVVWHEPMTVMDYRQATGMSRRTIQNFLSRSGARPIEARKGRNAPARYGRETNGAVLVAWLIGHVDDRHTRRGWAARILILTRHKAPTHYEWLLELMCPVVITLGLSGVEFIEYLSECEEHLHPASKPAADAPVPRKVPVSSTHS